MKKVGVGVIGCGVISGAYLKAAKDFPILDIRGTWYRQRPKRAPVSLD